MAERTLQNDENFRIFFHRGHNYTHDEIKKEWIISNADIMTRCYESMLSSFYTEWRGSETEKDKYTRAEYMNSLAWVYADVDQGMDANGIVQLSVSSYSRIRLIKGTPAAFIRILCFGPLCTVPQKELRGLILVPLKRHSYSVCLVCPLIRTN